MAKKKILFKTVYNSKGEQIQEVHESKVKKSDICNDTINFCCIAPIPEGFVLPDMPPDPMLTSVC